MRIGKIQIYSSDGSLIEEFDVTDASKVIVSDSQIILHLEPINIYLEISEKNLGERNTHPYIEPILREYFITEFNSNFIADKQNSDINIKVNVSTRTNMDKPNEFGIYQTFADATIDITINNNDITI